MDLVRSGDLELAATLFPISEDLDWQDVRREPLVAVLAADHPSAGASSTDLATLKELPFVLFAEGFAISGLILQGCRRGFEPNIAARSSQVDFFLIELAAAGMGVAFLPRILAEQGRGSRVRTLLLTEPETEWRLMMIWRRGATFRALQGLGEWLPDERSQQRSQQFAEQSFGPEPHQHSERRRRDGYRLTQPLGF